MATHDYVIANGTGAAVRADLNNALAAIVSNNSGTSEPATTYAYQWWADTTNNLLKLRNSANNAWITLRELDGTLLMEDGSNSAPGLSFASDTNTGFFSGGADKIGFATGGVERLEIGSSEVVFNDPSNDVDFRVESNGNTHMLFVDAGNDAVVIGGSSALDSTKQLTLTSTTTSGGLGFLSPNNGRGDIFFGDADDDNVGQIRYSHSNNDLTFRTNASDALVIDSSGRLLVGTSSASGNNLLQIEGDAADIQNPGGIFLRRGLTSTEIGSVTGRDLGIVNFGTKNGDVGAQIYAESDATMSTGDSPGRLVFGTTADGASSPTERARIDKNGNLQVNGGQFTVGTTASTGLQLINDGTFGTLQSADLKFRTNSSERARIDTSGNVGLGTTSPTDHNGFTRIVDISGSGGGAVYCRTGTSSSNVAIFGQSGSDVYVVNKASGNTRFFVADAEAMRLDSSGRLLVGATSTSVSDDKVLVSGQLNAGGVRFASLAKSDTVGSTMTFDISGSNEGYVFVRIRIKVGYSGNAGYQMHAQYDYATCNFYTSGATATQTGILQVEAANAQFNYSDITVTRPANRTVRVQYAPSSGSGTHNCKIMVDGAFDSIS